MDTFHQVLWQHFSGELDKFELAYATFHCDSMYQLKTASLLRELFKKEWGFLKAYEQHKE